MDRPVGIDVRLFVLYHSADDTKQFIRDVVAHQELRLALGALAPVVVGEALVVCHNAAGGQVEQLAHHRRAVAPALRRPPNTLATGVLIRADAQVRRQGSVGQRLGEGVGEHQQVRAHQQAHAGGGLYDIDHLCHAWLLTDEPFERLDEHLDLLGQAGLDRLERLQHRRGLDGFAAHRTQRILGGCLLLYELLARSQDGLDVLYEGFSGRPRRQTVEIAQRVLGDGCRGDRF